MAIMLPFGCNTFPWRQRELAMATQREMFADTANKWKWPIHRTINKKKKHHRKSADERGAELFSSRPRVLTSQHINRSGA